MNLFKPDFQVVGNYIPKSNSSSSSAKTVIKASNHPTTAAQPTDHTTEPLRSRVSRHAHSNASTLTLWTWDECWMTSWYVSNSVTTSVHATHRNITSLCSSYLCFTRSVELGYFLLQKGQRCSMLLHSLGTVASRKNLICWISHEAAEIWNF